MNPVIRSTEALTASLGDFLTAPYLTRALLIVLILAIPAGILGTWIVLRRMAFFTHAVGQVTFPAMVFATIVGWSLLWTSIGAAALAAVLLPVSSRRRSEADGAAVGVMLACALALGAFLVSDVADPGVSVNALLFGSLLSTSDADVWAACGLAALTLATVFAVRRTIVLSTFDPQMSRAEGRFRTRTTELVILVLLATAVAIAVRMVGSLLVAGLFLIPAATARLVTHRLTPLMVTAVGVTAVTGVLGLVLADATAWPPGATIAAVSASLFVVVLAVSTVARRVGALPRIFPT